MGVRETRGISDCMARNSKVGSAEVPTTGQVFHVLVLLWGIFLEKMMFWSQGPIFMFAFIFIILGGRSKKILLWFMSKSVFPMFSFMSFIVNGLASRSLMHFEFIFVYGVREW